MVGEPRFLRPIILPWSTTRPSCTPWAAPMSAILFLILTKELNWAAFPCAWLCSNRNFPDSDMLFACALPGTRPLRAASYPWFLRNHFLGGYAHALESRRRNCFVLRTDPGQAWYVAASHLR